MPVYTHLPLSDNGSISTTDIYRVLRILRRNNGDELNYANSNAHGKTKMWAKYKPEAYGDSPAPLTEAQRKANNYGIRPSILTAFDGVVDTAVNAKALSEVTFTYVAPGANNWMRTSDWIGYEHKATAPHGKPDDVDVPFGTTEVELGLSKRILHFDGALTLEDFSWATFSGNPVYFTVLVFWEKSDGSAWSIAGRMSSEQAISATSETTVAYSVKIPVSQLTGLVTPTGYNKQLKFFCCLCDHQYTSFSEGASSGHLYPLLSEEPPVANLTLQKTAAVSLNVTHVGPKNIYETTNTRVRPISEFQLPTVTSAHCWGVQTTGMWLHGQLTNHTGTAVTLQRLNILFKYFETLATTVPAQKSTPCSAIWRKSGSTWESVSSVTVPANGTLDVIFGVSTIPYLDDSGIASFAIRDYVLLNLTVSQSSATSSQNTAILGQTSLYVADSTEPGDYTFDGRL